MQELTGRAEIGESPGGSAAKVSPTAHTSTRTHTVTNTAHKLFNTQWRIHSMPVSLRGLLLRGAITLRTDFNRSERFHWSVFIKKFITSFGLAINFCHPRVRVGHNCCAPIGRKNWPRVLIGR